MASNKAMNTIAQEFNADLLMKINGQWYAKSGSIPLIGGFRSNSEKKE